MAERMDDVGRPRANSVPSWSVMTLSQVTGLPVSIIWSDLKTGVLSGVSVQGKTVIRLEDLSAAKRDQYRNVAGNLGYVSREREQGENIRADLGIRLSFSTSWRNRHAQVYRGETVKLLACELTRADRLTSCTNAPSLSPGIIALSGFAGARGARPVFVVGPEADLDQDLISVRLLPQIVFAYPLALQTARRILSRVQESPNYLSNIVAQLILDYGTKAVVELAEEAWSRYRSSELVQSRLLFTEDQRRRTIGGVFFQLIKAKGYWDPQIGSGSSQAVMRGEVRPISAKIEWAENQPERENSLGHDIDMEVELGQIFVPRVFEMHPPHAEKVRQALAESSEYPVLVKHIEDENRPYLLLDGYTRYLAARQKHRECIWVHIV